MSYLEIGILIILAWIFGILSLRPQINKSKHFQTMGGVLLLIKVRKNRGILDKVAAISDSKFYSRLSIGLVYILFATGVAVLLYGTILSFHVKENIPVTEYLLIPGINPDVPVVYGIIALALSLAIHEMFHGIVARKHGIKVNSVGLMLFVVPIGAFVEPDEQEITSADPVVRRRVVGAGIAINFVIAIVMFLLFSLVFSHAAVQAVPGAYVASSSLTNSSNIIDKELISFGPYTGNNLTNLAVYSNLTPGSTVKAAFYNGNSTTTSDIIAGISVACTYKGFPAYQNITAGDYILSINNKKIYNETVLSSTLDGILPGKEIIMVLGTPSSNGLSLSEKYFNFTAPSAYTFYSKYDPSALTPAMKNESFVGVGIAYGGLGLESISLLKQIVFADTAYSGSFNGALETIALPFGGYSPIPAQFAHLFKVPMGFTDFYFLANTVYWLFWVNFLLSITNALPLSIFDGAQFLRDTLMIASRREKFKYFREEKNIAGVLSLATTLILLMLMIEIIVPRII